MTHGEGDEIVAVLMNVMWAGARLDRLVDLHGVLQAIETIQPMHYEGHVVLAWWHVRARAWPEALRELRCTERHGVLSPLATGLSAVCLYALGDPRWHTYACAAAYQTDDLEASRMALALLQSPPAPLARAKFVERQLLAVS